MATGSEFTPLAERRQAPSAAYVARSGIRNRLAAIFRRRRRRQVRVRAALKIIPEEPWRRRRRLVLPTSSAAAKDRPPRPAPRPGRRGRRRRRARVKDPSVKREGVGRVASGPGRGRDGVRDGRASARRAAAGKHWRERAD